MKTKGFVIASVIALTAASNAWAWKKEPPPTPAPQPSPTNVSAVAAPFGSVNGTLGQTAKQDLEAELNAQQNQYANQKQNAEQELNAKNSASQSATTRSGNANTESGPAYTRSGNISQQIDGSAGNNTLKSISEGGTSTLNGTVKGTNEGYFKNDGRQNTAVDARGGNTSIGPVSSTSYSEGGRGGQGGTSHAKGGSVGNVGNGNGSGNTFAPAANSTSAGGTSQATGNGAGNETNISTTTVVKHIEVPVLFNPLPPMINSNGTMETRVTACGPLMQVVRSPIKGTHVGIFRNTYIDLGQDMELAPVYDANGEQQFYSEQKFANGVTRLFGSQAVITTALPNVSGASTVSIGFAGTNGGGNGGAGSSSAMSRIVTKVTIAPCELPGAYMVATEKQVVGLTAEDLKAALASQLRIEVPTDRVVTEKVRCKVEPFTDSKGNIVNMCRGPKGSYETKKVIHEKAVGTATNAVRTEKK